MASITTKPAVIMKILNQEGYHLTPQRRAIVGILIRHSKEYLDCELIYSLVKVDYPAMGIATNYRTLSLLEQWTVIMDISFMVPAVLSFKFLDEYLSLLLNPLF